MMTILSVQFLLKWIVSLMRLYGSENVCNKSDLTLTTQTFTCHRSCVLVSIRIIPTIIDIFFISHWFFVLTSFSSFSELYCSLDQCDDDCEIWILCIILCDPTIMYQRYKIFYSALLKFTLLFLVSIFYKNQSAHIFISFINWIKKKLEESSMHIAYIWTVFYFKKMSPNFSRFSLEKPVYCSNIYENAKINLSVSTIISFGHFLQLIKKL